MSLDNLGVLESQLHLHVLQWARVWNISLLTLEIHRPFSMSSRESYYLHGIPLRGTHIPTLWALTGPMPYSCIVNKESASVKDDTCNGCSAVWKIYFALRLKFIESHDLLITDLWSFFLVQPLSSIRECPIPFQSPLPSLSTHLSLVICIEFLLFYHLIFLFELYFSEILTTCNWSST